MAKLQGVILLNTDAAALQIVDSRGRQIEHVKREYSESDLALAAFSTEVMQRALVQLQRFQQLLRDYEVDDIRLYGSENLSKMLNAIYFVDQVENITGLELLWLNANQENYYRQLALRVNDEKILNERYAFVLGISSTRVDLSYFENNQFKFSQHSAVGPVRLTQSIRNMAAEITEIPDLIPEFIDSKLADFWHMLPPFQPTDTVVLLGADVLNHLFLNKKNKTTILKSELQSLIASFSQMNKQAFAEQYNIEQNDIWMVFMEAVLVVQVMTAVGANNLHISNLTVLDGLVIKDNNAQNDIITAARGIADRYMVEEKHREIVLKYVWRLFDRLKKIHRLSARDRLLLGVAALTHDVGSFINSQKHYQYSEEILEGIDFHGLSTSEQRMIASIARYHSAETPDNALRSTQDFSPRQRIRIAKMAALLRLADALDDSRLQKISKLTVSIGSEKITVTGQATADLQLEIYIFAQKAHFFEAVFGLPIILKRQGKRS
ncbi:guanosine pentaphosphate phosphohydrolase [Leuconostoc suionicum]|uniref:Guanosine pentaphosphate phosphohydrolase n=1 Tax=Leuconostoc suionicum TaxID=1511761 RepID=A0A2N9KHA5_9LACO|nr:HD domain-containing protein [Leuconostoc suionicum]SPD94728.1 guanosine pentaphosphate phosphohydrolase [Leuconostoc suionicum]SPE09671.1 guanosine pentaphosphate phosphohydrolase [Leuconostoc suionicum]SPH05257.1 guanosine pentaphosphate phosphohydrolase [Leuconostoc suionicum]